MNVPRLLRSKVGVLAALALWAAASGVCVGGADAAPDSPTAAVRDTVEAVLTVLRDATLDPAARRERTLAAVDRRFDFRAMSRRTLATNWRNSDDGQRTRITAAFRALLANTYWRKLAGYKGERVEYVSERRRGPRLATVQMLIKREASDIPVDYKLYLRDDGWYAYDVAIEQVSLVRNYRSSFQDIVRNDGINGLIAVLERKAAALDGEAGQ